MTNTDMERKAKEIAMLLEPSLEKKKGYYITQYGHKTIKGLIAMIFNVIADK